MREVQMKQKNLQRQRDAPARVLQAVIAREACDARRQRYRFAGDAENENVIPAAEEPHVA